MTKNDATQRIIANLKNLGLWQPIDDHMAEHAAKSCMFYLRMVKTGIYTQDLEDSRLIARTWLVEILYLPKERKHIALLNEKGVDSDIVAVCEPATTEPTN